MIVNIIDYPSEGRILTEVDFKMSPWKYLIYIYPNPNPNPNPNPEPEPEPGTRTRKLPFLFMCCHQCHALPYISSS